MFADQTIGKVRQTREENLYQKRLAYLETIAEPENGETMLEKAKSNLVWHLEVMREVYEAMTESGKPIAHYLRHEPKSELKTYEKLFEFEGIDIYEKPDMIAEFNIN
jgi:hypothetical protein